MLLQREHARLLRRHSGSRQHQRPGRTCTPCAAVFVDVAAIKTDELEDWSVLDCRSHEAYLAGHVVGAVHVSWQRELCHPAPPADRLRLEPDFVAPVLEKKGITLDKPVLVYGGDAPEEQRRAAQVWWALRVHGHPRAHLLRGAGYGAWLAARPQDTELYEPCPLKLCSVFEGELQPGLVWQPHQAPEGDAGVVLVDVDLFGEEAGEVPAGRGAGGRTVFVSRSGQNHAEACFRAARHEDAGGGPWAVAH